jgi:predicted metal-dependent hydrolase
LDDLLKLESPKPEQVTIVKTRFYIPWVDTDFGSAIRTRFEQIFYGITVSKEIPCITFFTSKDQISRHKFFTEDSRSKKPFLDMGLWGSWWSVKPVRNIPSLVLFRGKTKHHFDRITITASDMVIITNRPEGNTETVEQLERQIKDWISTFDALLPFIGENDLHKSRWELQDISALAKYSKKIEEFKAADKEFAESQDVLKDAKAKYEEALATGNADAILKQRDELNKAQQDYKLKKVDMLNEQAKLQNTAAGNALHSATQLTTQGMSDLTQLQIAKLREATARAGLTKPSESERVGTEYRRILQAGGQKAADAFLADETKVRAAVGGVKYEGQDTSTKDSKAVQDAINKRTTIIDTQLQSGNLKPEKEADLRARRERIASQVRKEMGVSEGGGGGQFSVPAPDGKTYQFNSQAEADAFKRKIGG